MSTFKNPYPNNTACATYIAGWGTSAWIAGLAQPVKRTPQMEIGSGYCEPISYQQTEPQTKIAPSPAHIPTGLFPTISYDDHGWGE